MSIKDSFIEKFGDNSLIEDRCTYKDIVISYSCSIHCALLKSEDLERVKNVKDWKPFTITKFDCDYLMIDDICGYWGKYIRKAIEVINPNEYAIYEDWNQDDERDEKILALKNGGYTIIICPWLKSGEEWEEYFKIAKMEDYLKDVPKDVFVL